MSTGCNAECRIGPAQIRHLHAGSSHRDVVCTVSILFIGKRFYTNRDALREKYGRVYQLPWHWAHAGIPTRLWLVDYHTREPVHTHDGALEIVSTPVRDLSVVWRWMKETRRGAGHPDVVVASGDCYIGLMAYSIARRLRARFVFDVYDKYDEFGAYHRLIGFDPFRFLLRKADTRLFASRALMHDLSQDKSRDALVPNGVGLRRFRPLDRDESRAKLDLPRDALYIGYFGGMESDRGVADLIDAIALLRDEHLDVELLLGGKPPAELDVDRDGVRFLGDVPFERMPLALASCDVLAVPYRRSAFMDAGASNKIAEAIACARPLVATRTPNFMANFPTQAQQLGSLLATPGDATDLARVIRVQLSQRALLDMPGGMDWQSIAIAVADRLSLRQPCGSASGATPA